MPATDPPDLTDDPLAMTPPALSPLRAASRPRPRPVTPASVVGRPHNEGHGKRLTAAFEALEVFPALAESRNRLLALIAEERPSVSAVVGAIESDVALVIAVLRLANSLEGRSEALAVALVVRASDDAGRGDRPRTRPRSGPQRGQGGGSHGEGIVRQIRGVRSGQEPAFRRYRQRWTYG